AALANLLDGLDRRNSSLQRLADAGGADMRQAVERLSSLFAAARAVAADVRAPTSDRAQAVRLLGRGPDQQAQDLDRLAALLVPQTAEDLQSAAIAALARSRDSGAAERLLRGWAGYVPGLRGQVLEVLSRRSDGSRWVLDAIERGDVAAAEIDAARRDQLLRHREATVRTRATRLLGGATSPDRQKVLDEFGSVVTLKGNAERGRPLFAKHCATCHKLAGSGGDVGPDLSGLADKPADYLLTAIL